MKTCHYCQQAMLDEELRPYGPGGADVCQPCVVADPEREEIAKRAFFAQAEASAAMSPIGMAIVNGGAAPMPATIEQLKAMGVDVVQVECPCPDCPDCPDDCPNCPPTGPGITITGPGFDPRMN